MTHNFSNKKTQKNNYSLNTPILHNETFVSFFKSNYSYIEKNFKNDFLYPYFQILIRIDSKVGIRVDDFNGTLFLTFPGHLYRSTNYVMEYIFSRKKGITPTDAKSKIENKLKPLHNMGYIYFNFENPYYNSYWFTSNFMCTQSEFCHIYVRGYDHTLTVPPKFHPTSKKTEGYSTYFTCEEKRIVRIIVDAKLEDDVIVPSFKPERFHEKKLSHNLNRDKENCKNNYCKIIKSVFDNRAISVKNGEHKFSNLEAFFDLYAHTVFKDPTHPLSSIYPIVIIDGQVVLSHKKLALRWGWDCKTVKNFFEKHSFFFKTFEISNNHDKVIFNIGLLENESTNPDSIFEYIESSLNFYISQLSKSTKDVVTYIKQINSTALNIPNISAS